MIESFSLYHFEYGALARQHVILKLVLPQIFFLGAIVSLFFLGIRFIQNEKTSFINIIGPPIVLFTLNWTNPIQIIGLSYIMFRISLLAVEVRSKKINCPNFTSFLSYISYLPLLFIGPISEYSVFDKSFQNVEKLKDVIGGSLLRFLVGVLKITVFANLARQLSFGVFWNNAGPHSVLDFFISCCAYYLFLYANFSGACDMVISMSRLIGIRVQENFNSPFKSRNINEFWSRWHITLSNVIKGIIYVPLSKFLVDKIGARHVNLSIAVSTLSVFLILGLWHGMKINFILFGLMHGIAAIIVQIYSIWLKSKKIKLKHYKNNTWFKIASIAITFVYVSISMSLFENNLGELMIHLCKIKSII